MPYDQLIDERPSFTQIDDRILHMSLSPRAGWLYVCITSFTRKGQPTAFPSIATLSKMTGMSDNTVRKYRDELVERGLIHVAGRVDDDGRQTSHLYTIVNPAFLKGDPSNFEPSPLQNLNPPPSKLEDEEEPTKHNQKKEMPTPDFSGQSVLDAVTTDDEPPSPVDELETAYREATNAIALTPSHTDYARLRAMHDAGITPDDIRKFVEDRKRDSWWRDKRISLKHIAENIGDWKKAYTGFVHVHDQTKPTFNWYSVADEKQSA